MTDPAENPLQRFARYTTGTEPVITVNVIAALILGVVVKVTEQWYAWDEFSLTLAGIVTLAVATWFARNGVFSPATHEADVQEALRTPPPEA